MKISANRYKLLFGVLGMLIFTLNAEKSMAIECYECHGSKSLHDYRPVDSSYRNIYTGGFQGNHLTHMGPSANASSCASCHPGTAEYGPGHRDSKIDISPNINNSPMTAVYRNGSTAFPQRAIPRLGSCRNVNCHFEQDTPTWGGAAFTIPGSCTKCHGAPPNGTTPAFIGGASGSHDTHNAYYAGTSNCVKCHRDHAGEVSPFAHATSILSRAIAVQLRNPLNTSYGSYSGGAGGYLPSQASSHTFGTCRTTYCHSTVQADGGSGLPTYGVPTWGTSLPDCNSTCHAVGGHNDEPVISTGSHTKHLSYSFGLNSSASAVGKCTICHHWPATPTNSAYPCAGCHTPLSRVFTKHVNGKIDIAFNAAVTNGAYDGIDSPMTKYPGSGYRVCSNTYCHSSGVSLATGIVPHHTTAIWGSGAVACNSCHGTPPGYLNGQPKANSHTQHGGTTCDDCHFGTTIDGSTISSTRLHVNKAYNITPGNGITFQYKFAATGGICSNVSCHYGGTAKWGTKLACDGCHGAPPDTPSHKIHFGGYTTQAGYGDVRIAKDFSPNATSYIMNCGNCHPMNDTKHGNGLIEVELYNSQAPAGSLKAMNLSTAAYTNGTTIHIDSRGFPYTNGTCSNIYCHSYNEWTTPGGVAPLSYTNYSTYLPPNLIITRHYKTVIWNSPSLTCSGCHGYPPRTKYPDNDFGSGDSHSWINGGGFGYDNGFEELHNLNHYGVEPLSCRTCHYETVRTSNTWTLYTSNKQAMWNPSDVPINNFSKHVSGKGSVDFDRVNPIVYNKYWGTATMTLESAQYDPDRMTCTNVSCHRDQKFIRWGVPYNRHDNANQCNVCHGV